MTKSQTVERGVKRWLFRKTNNPEDLKKVMDEYRTTGKLRLTLRQRLNVWVHRMVMAPGTRETFYPASDEDADLGSVSWFLTHCETGEIISQAESVPMLSQTQIELSSSGITGETQSKTILLSDRYKLELHDSRTESVKEGFALNAKDQLDPMSFGWEWFLVDA